MKIAYITHYAPLLSKKADPICIMKTCSSLQNTGIEMNLVIPSDQGEPLSSISKDKDIWTFYNIHEHFEIGYIPSKFLYRLGIIGRVIYKIWSAIYAIFVKKNKILIVRHAEIAFLGILLGARVFLEHHQIDLLRKNKTFPYLLYYIQHSGKRLAFIVITHAAKDTLTSLGIPEDKILIAPMGVDLNLFSNIAQKKWQLSIPENKKVVGFSGNLYEGRGIEELIEAAQYFPNLFFCIVGGVSSDVERCQDYAKLHKVHNIQFYGYMSQQILYGLLSDFDILVMPYTTKTPTHKDMSPMKLFEYMAAAKPIVATDFPVIREILHHKVNAILVPPDSSKALADGIQWCLENPLEARKLAQQARLDVEQYTWDKRAKQIKNWIEMKLSAR